MTFPISAWTLWQTQMPLVNTNRWDWSQVEPQEARFQGKAQQAGPGVTMAKLDAGGFGGSARGLLLVSSCGRIKSTLRSCPSGHYRLVQR